MGDEIEDTAAEGAAVEHRLLWYNIAQIVASMEIAPVDAADIIEANNQNLRNVDYLLGKMIEVLSTRKRIQAMRVLQEIQASVQGLKEKLAESDTHNYTELLIQDPLTGLHKADWFKSQLEWRFAGELGDRRIALMFCDIRDLKGINSAFSHPAGTEALRQMSQIMRHVRMRSPRDVLAHYGGDEFCFILSDVDEAVATGVAQRLRDLTIEQDWATAHPNFRDYKVQIDTGIVCVALGPLQERRQFAVALASKVLELASKLMLKHKDRAKHQKRPGVIAAESYEIKGGELIQVRTTK